MTAELSDEDLMVGVASGESAALGRLYDRYGTSVFSLALRMLGDHLLAEEVVQETFLRVWRQAGVYAAARGTLGAWVLGIARNLAIDELRRRGVRPQAAPGDADERLLALEAGDPAPEEQVYARVQHDIVTGALAQLPEVQRHVLELAYFDGLSQSEIAARLGDPLGTVKTRMRLGLQKLKSILGPGETELEPS